MRVFVVGFAPIDDRAATGGFDWFYQADLAALNLREKIAADLPTQHSMIHSYTLVPLEIPESVCKSVDVEGIGPAITDWIDSHLDLVQVSRVASDQTVCPVCGQPDNCGDCTHEPV